MSLHTPEPIECTQTSYENLPRPMRTDTYQITRFNEDDSAELTALARSIHAAGYLEKGFVSPSAVADGQLSENIDKARGPLVDYYIGLRDQDSMCDITDVASLDAATMRKIHLPIGGTVKDLPAYRLCHDSLYTEDAAYLLGIDNADLRLKEVGALAGTRPSSPVGIYELLRNGVQEASGAKEVWFFSIVSTTYDALVNNFGDNAFRQAGSPVTIHDQRVSDSVHLIPVIADVDGFINNVYQSLMSEGDSSARRRQLRSFLFFSEGLRDDELGDELAQARRTFLGALEGEAGGRRVH